MPALTQLLVNAPAAASATNTHTLICVFLRGGADTLNLVVPFADDHYYNARPTLAVKRPGASTEASIKLDDRYALHPLLKPLESAFKEGRLGMVQGVGTDSVSGSHFECQDLMEHGDSEKDRPTGGGWLGRFLRSRADQSSSALSAVAIGTQLPESLRGAPSVSVLEHIDDISIKAPSGDPKAVVGALHAMYGADVTLLGQRGQQTLDLFQRVTAMHSSRYSPENGAEYPVGNSFADGLRELARLIKARVGLEVACIDLPGWDTHFFQNSTAGGFASNARKLAEGLVAFETDLQKHRKDYTIMVTTEFGRRIYENASLGTDHGRGFCFMALGDKVKGGRVLGNWPIGAMDETQPSGPGGVGITLDYREVFAEVLAGAMGAIDERKVFPGASLGKVGLMA
jgi:uncharacterized protein (DUF1501 family)